MWRMVGRPERSDPDEMTFNLFHFLDRAARLHFIGYNNPEYDKIAEQQRQTVDPEARKALIRQAQEIVNRDQPYAFMIHPNTLQAFNQNVFDPADDRDAEGRRHPQLLDLHRRDAEGRPEDDGHQFRHRLQAIHPLYIGRSAGQLDERARLGAARAHRADGLPRPWAAESFKFVDDKTVDVTIRKDMKFHDGKPVTVDDVLFSYEAPMNTDKSPMFKPFVVDIDRIEKTGEHSLRFHLKRVNAAFAGHGARPRLHRAEACLGAASQEPRGQAENLETIRDAQNIGSGPFRQVRARLNEEIVLDRFADIGPRRRSTGWCCASSRTPRP